MNYGHCTGDRDQDHLQGQEMQKAKWLSEEAFSSFLRKEEKLKAKEKMKKIPI